MITAGHKSLQVELDEILRELKLKKITPEVARIRINAVKTSAGMHRIEADREGLILRLEKTPPAVK